MQTISVLIVDDSVTIRAVMEQVLISDPRFWVAGIASSIDEARLMMKTVPHDLVTLDLAMPGTNGLQFLEELTTRTHVPVIVVSSATTRDSIAEGEALKLGAATCFDKAKLLSDVAGFLRALRKAATFKPRKLATYRLDEQGSSAGRPAFSQRRSDIPMAAASVVNIKE